MKLMPASSARWMMRIESSWSRLPQSPNIMAPRQSGLTRTPVRPRGRGSMASSLDDRPGPPVSAGRAQTRVRLDRGVALARRLGDRPAPRGTVDRQHGPVAAILAAEMDEQRVAVVLDAQPVPGIAVLVQDAPGRGGGDERGPPRRHGAQPRPTNGIFVAVTVMNSTLASSGRPAM